MQVCARVGSYEWRTWGVARGWRRPEGRQAGPVDASFARRTRADMTYAAHETQCGLWRAWACAAVP